MGQRGNVGRLLKPCHATVSGRRLGRDVGDERQFLAPITSYQNSSRRTSDGSVAALTKLPLPVGNAPRQVQSEKGLYQPEVYGELGSVDLDIDIQSARKWLQVNSTSSAERVAVEQQLSRLEQTLRSSQAAAGRAPKGTDPDSSATSGGTWNALTNAIGRHTSAAEFATEWEAWGGSGLGAVGYPHLTGEKISAAADLAMDQVLGWIEDHSIETGFKELDEVRRLERVIASTVVKTIGTVAVGLVVGVIDPASIVRGILRLGEGTAAGLENIDKGNVAVGLSQIAGEAAQVLSILAGIKGIPRSAPPLPGSTHPGTPPSTWATPPSAAAASTPGSSPPWAGPHASTRPR